MVVRYKMKKTYEIFYHKRKDKEIVGIKKINAYSIRQAKYLFDIFHDNAQRNWVIDKVNVL